MKKTTLSLVAIATAGLAGCDLNLAEFFGFTHPEPQIARLLPFASEVELKEYLTGQNNQPVRPGVDIFFFAEDADVATSAGGDNAPTAAPTADGAGDDSGGGERSFSTTTEQEEGVQEADVIKNDGEYLYVLSRDSLRIVKATPAADMTETGSVAIDGFGIDMYLVGDHVVTLTTPNEPIFLGSPVANGDLAIVAPDYAFYRPQTLITVIDVADRAQPRILSTTRVDGSVNTSRMIGERMYLVLVNYPEVFVQPLLEGAALKSSTFDDLPLDDILPDIAVSVDGGEVFRGNIAEFDEHFRPEAEDGLGLTSIVSFDISDPAGYDAQTIVAYPANVYASPNALYLTDTDYNFNGDLRETTDIFKFDFTATGIAQSAAGTVPGRVLNQYSMSEHAGFLRIATTKGATFGPLGQTTPSTNNVYVLEQFNDELQLAGSVENLAPGESIFSARFIGDKGYLVTFLQVDPLFTLDLSDPRNPQAVGELKVAGVSTFIMPMGDDHLLTVGRDSDGDFGFTQGVRLSIFDVRDFANPQLAHFEVIGENGNAYSEATYNPKAFTYFASGDLVALPVEIYGNRGGFFDDAVALAADGGGDSDAGSAGQGAPPDETVGDEPVDVVIDLPAPEPEPSDDFRGLYVYRATTTNGFEFLGRISSQLDDDNSFFFGPQFTRGAFIEDAVYCATSDNVQAAMVADVPNVVATVRFPIPDNGEDLPPIPLPVDDTTVNAEPVIEPTE